jgi:hypothetical protein
VLIWFGVIIAMNLQTSFLTPPFGFALFYLRSVAARNDYKDRLTGETIPAVTTAQIYKGAIAFIVIQLIMVVAVVVFPGIAIDTATKAAVDLDKIQLDAPKGGYSDEVQDPMRGFGVPGGAPADAPKAAPAEEDPMEAVKRSLQNEAKK